MLLGLSMIKGLICLALIPSLFLSLSAKNTPDITNLEEQVRWLKENGVSIRTVAPDDEDFADLMPLVDKIGSSRLVLLGEQSHGDGTTFLMKCRLVRFLHQVMGFDVLAWESGLYDCRRMESALHSDVPLDMAGYDCQFSSPMTVTSFAKELTAFLERPGEKWISSEMFSGLKKLSISSNLQK